MFCQFFPVRFVFRMKMLEFFCQSYPNLTDMVGYKCRCHRNALRLAEGIILHGGDKVDRYLEICTGADSGTIPGRSQPAFPQRSEKYPSARAVCV